MTEIKESEKLEKTNSLNELADLPKEKQFHLDDGRSIKSIKELLDSLDSISDDEFNKHLFNNNFGKWIKGVFNDNELYHKLLWAKNKEEYKEILKERIYEIENPKIEKIIETPKVEKTSQENESNKLDKPIISEKINETIISKKEVVEEIKLKTEIKEPIKEIVKESTPKKEELFNELEHEKLKEKLVGEIKKTFDESVLLSNEKDKLLEEKSEFNDIEYDHFFDLANKEFDDKKYDQAITNYEKAYNIKKDNIILEKINLSKKLLDFQNKVKSDEDFKIELKTKPYNIQLETFKLKYNEFKEKIKNLRKEGKDLYIAELQLIPLNSKIMIAQVTHLEKDLEVIRKIISNVENEIKEVEAEKFIDLKNEIDEGARTLINEEIKKQAQEKT